MRTSWLKGTLLLVVVFVAGVLVGGWHERLGAGGAFAGLHGAPASMNHEDVLQLLDESLHLDSAQRAGITAIMQRHQAVIDATWRQLRPPVRATLDTVHAEVLALLRPDQREAFFRFVRSHSEHP